jgi:ActR/RegA family two-component response regulator
VHEYQPTRFVIDNVTSLDRIMTEDEIADYLRTWSSSLTADGITVLLTAQGRSPTSLVGDKISRLVDNIIFLRDSEMEGSLRRSLAILKARGVAHDRNIREFAITPKGVVIGEENTYDGQPLAATSARHPAQSEGQRMLGRWWRSENWVTDSDHARILVVDDDRGIRESLEAVLKEEGYEVDLAENGQQAIQKSKANYYNLALVDLRLPDMDGLKLLTDMMETVPKVVKIIITGYPSLQNAIEAVNRGADGYMVKPYKMEDLLRMIRESLRKQEEARRYSEQKVKEFIETRFKERETQRS